MKTTRPPKAVSQYEAIEAHGKNLLAIFQNATERDPVTLCKKLRRLEAAAHSIALRLCNGPEYAEGEADQACASILAKVNAILGNPGSVGIRLGGKPNVPVFINRDPRGYALKIESAWTLAYCQRTGRRIYSDWGGYGIIAPEITGD